MFRNSVGEVQAMRVRPDNIFTISQIAVLHYDISRLKGPHNLVHIHPLKIVHVFLTLS